MVDEQTITEPIVVAETVAQEAETTVAGEMAAELDNTPKKFFSRFVLVLAVIVICFVGIFNHDLWTPDEPRVAAISLEMSRTGNLAIPHLAGEPFIEKPPLYFIVAAGLVRILGPIIGNTGAVRSTSLLFALATLLLFFLLARRLGGRDFAFLSLIIMGTMAGFVENFHWIRVDTALTFFVVAAIWCFAEVYLGGRIRLLPLAGFFSAGSFLSKGLIGPLLTAIPWVGLFLIWIWQESKSGEKKNYLIIEHLIALAVFLCCSGIWIILLRVVGGAELWHEWFWVNHVGRLNGTAVGLGHLRPGQPLYYVVALVLYSIPWLPLVFMWPVYLFKRLWRERIIAPVDILLLIWGVGTILFLSLSVTKRSIYLYPAVPAFAMMVGMVITHQDLSKRWFAVYTTAWSILSALLMAVMVIIPLPAYLLQSHIPARIYSAMNSFGGANLVAGIALLCTLMLILKRRKINLIFRFTVVTALLYMVAFTGPLRVVDREKSMQAGVRNFVKEIPQTARARVAGWNFSETMLANFYYYCDWSVPQIKSAERLQAILQHQDPDYDTVIINKAHSLEGLLKSPYQVIMEGNPRHSQKNKRKIFWVAGDRLDKGKLEQK